jgi:hypothetical protein
MSFMLGKVQVIFGVLGGILLLYNFLRNKHSKYDWLFIFIYITTLVSGFLTLYGSEFIWNLIKPMAVFQFPWRFLIITLFGISFFSAYFFSKNPIPYIQFLIPIAILFVSFSQSKYFYKPPVNKTYFEKGYASENSIETYVAYRVAEYLPVKADYKYWRDIEFNQKEHAKIIDQTKDFLYTQDNLPYKVISSEALDRKAVTSSQKVVLNVHYLPYWKISVNGKEYLPQTFDILARPVLTFTNSSPKTIRVYYQQTGIERLADILTVIAFIMSLALISPLNKRYLFAHGERVKNHDRSHNTTKK